MDACATGVSQWNLLDSLTKLSAKVQARPRERWQPIGEGEFLSSHHILEDLSDLIAISSCGELGKDVAIRSHRRVTNQVRFAHRADAIERPLDARVLLGDAVNLRGVSDRSATNGIAHRLDGRTPPAGLEKPSQTLGRLRILHQPENFGAADVHIKQAVDEAGSDLEDGRTSGYVRKHRCDVAAKRDLLVRVRIGVRGSARAFPRVVESNLAECPSCYFRTKNSGIEVATRRHGARHTSTSNDDAFHNRGVHAVRGFHVVQVAILVLDNGHRLVHQRHRVRTGFADVMDNRRGDVIPEPVEGVRQIATDALIDRRVRAGIGDGVCSTCHSLGSGNGGVS